MNNTPQQPPAQAAAIDALLAKLGRNKKWLAHFMGISRPTLYRWLAEDGSHSQQLDATIARLKRLAAAQEFESHSGPDEPQSGFEAEVYSNLPGPEFEPTGQRLALPAIPVPADRNVVVSAASEDAGDGRVRKGDLVCVALSQLARPGRLSVVMTTGLYELATATPESQTLGFVVAILRALDHERGAFGSVVWDEGGIS